MAAPGWPLLDSTGLKTYIKSVYKNVHNFYCREESPSAHYSATAFPSLQVFYTWAPSLMFFDPIEKYRAKLCLFSQF